MSRITDAFNANSKERDRKHRERLRVEREQDEEKKKKRQEQGSNLDDALFLTEVLVTQIASLEATLEARYGENFAENLAAEYLDESTYKRVMAISDRPLRRHEIAIELHNEVENGVSIDEIEFDSDLQDWMKAHVALDELEPESTPTFTSRLQTPAP